MKNIQILNPNIHRTSNDQLASRPQTPRRFGLFKLEASLVLGCCALMLLPCLSVQAQPFEITSSTIDGGGGTSTGGVYAVSGTNNPTVVPATMPGKFYRLSNP